MAHQSMSTQLLPPTFPPPETTNNFLFPPMYHGGLLSSIQGFPELEGIAQGLLSDPKEGAYPNALDLLVLLQRKSAIRTMHEKLCKTHNDDANEGTPSGLLDVGIYEVFPVKPVLDAYGPNHPAYGNSFHQYHTQPGGFPTPNIATTPPTLYVSGEFDILDGNEQSYEGGKRGRERYKEHAQHSPYNRTQQQHVANSEWWYGGVTVYPPLEPPPSLGPAYQEDTTAQLSGDRNGASPRFSEFRNRDGDAKVTSDFGLPSPATSPASSTPASSSSVDSRKSKKHYTDTKRSKDTNFARNRFKTLFPSTKLLTSGEIAIRVCKYMLSTRIVPRDEGDVQRWSNQTSVATSPSRPEGNKVRAKALPEDKLARRRESKRLSDSRRQVTKHALDSDLRALFGRTGSLLDTMELAYDFLVYAKERGTVPNMASPVWRRERALMNVAAGPFFDKAV